MNLKQICLIAAMLNLAIVDNVTRLVSNNVVTPRRVSAWMCDRFRTRLMQRKTSHTGQLALDHPSVRRRNKY